MIESFYMDDENYFNAIRKYISKNKGFVFNHYTKGPDTEFNKLHKFDCTSLPKKGENNATHYPKICSEDFYELFSYICNTYGSINEYFSYCRICNPNS
jgi:hypothetical protein